MSPKKSIKGQNKKNGKKLLLNHVLLKCVPCVKQFASSNDLIHHVFNDHNFQPNIHLEKVDDSIPEVLNNYITTHRRTPAKPKAPRKRKTPVKPKEPKDTTVNKPKRQRKEKKATLKVALVDSDGYSIPKIKIGRFNTTNAFSIDGSENNCQSSKQESKELPLINRLEPIQNSTTVTSSVSTASTSNCTSNGHASSSTDDGLSSLMSEVYNVLDGQDSTSLSLPTNGGDTGSEFLEMREIQGLYDDDMTYTHFASAFEIPQSKSLNQSSAVYPTSSNSLDYSSSNKMSTVDSLTSLSHNLDNLLNKPTPPSSCMLSDSTNPYLMNNSLPNHNTASSAFTSTNHKSPSLTNHSNNSSAFMLPSGSTSKVVPPGYASPNKTIPSGYVSPNNMMGYSSNSPSPLGVGAPCSSPHKSMSPHMNNVLSPSSSSTPGSPHSDGGKRKTGLNVIPTEKLLDTSSKQNQLINRDHASVSSSYYPLNSMMTSSVSSVTPYGSSYYNSMYPYMNHSSSQFMSSPSHMSSYYNFYPSPSSQPIEDSQYKRVDHLPPGPSLLPPPPPGPSLLPSGPPGPPPFKRPAEDSQFKRPPEPPNKQPKIVPKKLSTLLPTAGDKKPAASSSGSSRLNAAPMSGSVGLPYSIQRPQSSSQIISRPPGPPPVQIRGSSSIRPPPAPSLKGPPRPPGPSWGTSVAAAGSPSKPPSAPPPVDNPAASTLAKRGITISSVSKPPTRKLTSSVNITPVVKKSTPIPDRIGGGAVEIVSKISTPSRPAELIKDAECNLGIPVIDLSNQTVLNKLSGMGITSFIPVNQMRGSNQIMGLPIISTAQANRRMDDLGATGVLSLGSVYKLK